ncbi:MAG: hypothetical protein ACRBHB_08950 [Arenicella sp.]
MEDVADGLLKPVLKLILLLLRGLQFLAWDLFIESIGWTIGWYFYRIVTLGRYPAEGRSEQDETYWAKALFIEATGLLVLAGLIALLSAIV